MKSSSLYWDRQFCAFSVALSLDNAIICGWYQSLFILTTQYSCLSPQGVPLCASSTDFRSHIIQCLLYPISNPIKYQTITEPKPSRDFPVPNNQKQPRSNGLPQYQSHHHGRAVLLLLAFSLESATYPKPKRPSTGMCHLPAGLFDHQQCRA